ncbi:MAG: hypothetical protein ACR2J6_07995, partial [Thermoleophilaceae bacterium]
QQRGKGGDGGTVVTCWFPSLSPLAKLPDQATKWFLTGLAALILVIIAFFFIRLYDEAHPAFAKFGYLGFTFADN